MSEDLRRDLETVHHALTCAYRNLGILPNDSFPDFEALARIRDFVHQHLSTELAQPEDDDWIPKDDDYVRFQSGHVNAGKIERVQTVIGPPRASSARVRLVGVIDLVDPALLEPWRPMLHEWVTFRGGHALAGYSYPVTGYHGFLLQLQGLVRVAPTELKLVMPAGDGRIVVGPGCTLTPRA